MKAAFFDIDTQLDFLYPAGALYVPGAEKLLPNLAALNEFAARQGYPVVSTACAHQEDDAEFRQWPPHCVKGCLGQQKPPRLLLPRRVTVSSRSRELLLESAQQIILEKQQLDCFSNPNLPRLIDLLAAGRYVVYGVVTEYCVQCAAMGLLETGSGRPVFLVTDAIETLNPADAARMYEAFRAKGGRMVTTAQVLAGVESLQ